MDKNFRVRRAIFVELRVLGNEKKERSVAGLVFRKCTCILAPCKTVICTANQNFPRILLEGISRTGLNEKYNTIKNQLELATIH